MQVHRLDPLCSARTVADNRRSASDLDRLQGMGAGHRQCGGSDEGPTRPEVVQGFFRGPIVVRLELFFPAILLVFPSPIGRHVNHGLALGGLLYRSRRMRYLIALGTAWRRGIGRL